MQAHRFIGSVILVSSYYLFVPNVSAQPQVPSVVPGTEGLQAKSITMVGSIGLVSIEHGMLVLDFSQPSSPQFVSQLDLPARWPFSTLSGPFRIVVRDHFAFVPSWSVGFYIVDISDPFTPTVVGQTALPEAGRSVALYGDLAYVGGSKFVPGYIVDISNYQAPQQVGTLSFLDGGLFESLVVGSLLYVASGHIYVVDLVNPLAPAVIDTFPLINSCLGFTKHGDRVYGGDAYVGTLLGVGCFDVSNPASPELLGTLADGGGDAAVAALNERIWVANFLGGTFVGDVSDPSQPSAVVCYPTGLAEPCFGISGPYDPYSIIVYDRYVLVGTLDGLLAYELDPRGDVNANGTVSASDIILLVDHVFKSGPPPASPTQADTNCSGNLTSADIIILVNYAFKGTNVPACP